MNMRESVVYYVVELKQSQINMPSASTNLPKAEEPGVLVVVPATKHNYIPQALRPSMARVHQTLVCVLESYGALNVLLLGIIRFPRTWATGLRGGNVIHRSHRVDRERRHWTARFAMPRPAPPYELAPAIA